MTDNITEISIKDFFNQVNKDKLQLVTFFVIFLILPFIMNAFEKKTYQGDLAIENIGIKEFAKYEEQAKTKKFFVQVNIGKEKTKSGVYPNEIKDFLFFLKKEIQIPISGLMCIPPIDENPKYHFNKLKTLAEENDIKELSMGMSADYKEAIEFNPTYIRLGTILFGKR